MHTLPWQHYFLIAEMIVSVLIANHIRRKYKETYTLKAPTAYFWGGVEAAMVALLVWGAPHFAWQYVVAGIWFLADCFVNLSHVGYVRDMSRVNKHPVLNAYVSAFLIVVMFVLLYTGA